MRYLRELVLPHPAMKTILEEYLQGIDAAHARVERIEASMLQLLEGARVKPDPAARDRGLRYLQTTDELGAQVALLQSPTPQSQTPFINRRSETLLKQ